MKIKKRDQETLRQFIAGKISLRDAQKEMKLPSMTSVYVRGFHYLKALNPNVWTETTSSH